jgi:hypothetical protein
MTNNTFTKPDYLLQFRSRADLSLPWPVGILADGTVTSGRPDAYKLLGFQRFRHVQSLDVTLTVALETPSEAIGRYPVYSAEDGSGIFVVLERVATFDVVGA